MSPKGAKGTVGIGLVTIVLGVLLAYVCATPPKQPGAPATVAERIRNGGAHAQINIVILGDGFTAASDSVAAYKAAADLYATKLMSIAPFRSMPEAISIYRVDVVSKEAGVDVPVSCGGYNYAAPPHPSLNPWARTPRQRDTALGTTWCDSATNTFRYLDTNDWPAVLAAANQAGVYPNLVIVLVNDWFYGAAAWSSNPLGNGNGGVAFVSISKNTTGETNPISGAVLQSQDPTSFPDVAIHETGHLGPFLLLDEYGRTVGPVDPSDVMEIDASANVTRSMVPPLKWEPLRTLGSLLPTDCDSSPLPDTAAALAGAGYADHVFHSRCGCRMNGYATETFCPVCRQRVLQQLAGYIPPTNALRIMLDSLRLTSAPAGNYFVEYSVLVGSQSTTGRWPKAPSNSALDPSRTFEPTDLVADVPVPPVSPPAAIQFSYRLMKIDASSGSPIQIESASLTLPFLQLGEGRIVLETKATHRITLALAKR